LRPPGDDVGAGGLELLNARIEVGGIGGEDDVGRHRVAIGLRELRPELAADHSAVRSVVV
jgi:hypothetical protein